MTKTLQAELAFCISIPAIFMVNILHFVHGYSSFSAKIHSCSPNQYFKKHSCDLSIVCDFMPLEGMIVFFLYSLLSLPLRAYHHCLPTFFRYVNIPHCHSTTYLLYLFPVSLDPLESFKFKVLKHLPLNHTVF